VPWRRRNILVRALVHQTQHHSPRTRVGGAAPPGRGRRRASRRLYSVRTPRGWLGPARGEFLAPNSPLGPPSVLLADFWATGRARNPLDFVRWVVPIKVRGRYTLCSAIHRAEGVRRAWNSHFKLLAQVAIARTQNPGLKLCLMPGEQPRRYPLWRHLDPVSSNPYTWVFFDTIHVHTHTPRTVLAFPRGAC
jgi:hypothetical protein